MTRAGAATTPRPRAPAAAAGARRAALDPWLRAQSINVPRHAAALRPFRRDEFGTGAAAPDRGPHPGRQRR